MLKLKLPPLGFKNPKRIFCSLSHLPGPPILKLTHQPPFFLLPPIRGFSRRMMPSVYILMTIRDVTSLIFLDETKASIPHLGDVSLVKHRQENLARKIQAIFSSFAVEHSMD